ncbi:MAG: hypothetical protein OXG88_00230, partial [Gammaproteobacteria bacterium]|nr:hypothetical protein [Gammaproteobacteria bacterium]
HYCRQADLILVCEKTRYTPQKRRIQIDGEVVDAFDLPHGHWEAKDTHDDLPTEARKKSEAGYPFKNIIVQSPTRALLYQNGSRRISTPILTPLSRWEAKTQRQVKEMWKEHFLKPIVLVC